MTIKEFIQQSIDGALDTQQQLAYLEACTVDDGEELADAVRFLLTQMPAVPQLPGAVDVVGTGGSGLDTINTSTLATLILAGAGVRVAKHGNRSASGKFGSFDVLEALGVPIELSVDELQARFNNIGLAYLYAKAFHPSMRHFAEARSTLGTPTFFNYLGPLLSPVQATRQVIGVNDRSKMQLIAETAKALGKDHVLVVHGSDGLDEATVTGPTYVAELKDNVITTYTINPSDLGVSVAYTMDEIRGGNGAKNTAIAKAVLDGSASRAHTDLVLVNAALGLYVAGMVSDVAHGYSMAKSVLESGAAAEVLAAYKTPTILKTIADARAGDTDFSVKKPVKTGTRKYAGGLIAEIKKASPSAGTIANKVDVAKRAKVYEDSGAAAISVVTEPRHFGGALTDLGIAKKATSRIPILCKDFITTTAQIDGVARHGADMVLLIAAILSETQFAELHAHAEQLGLQVLCEVHDQDELTMVLHGGAKIVGVNTRNLHDFSMHPELFDSLRANISDDVLAVAESGMRSFAHIPASADGCLVGTELMKYPFPKLKIKELTGRPLIKLCGIRDVESAGLCEVLDVDMIGINFVPRSRRKVAVDQAKAIRSACDNTLVVGVFEDQSPEDVSRIADAVGLDAIQLSGNESVDEYASIRPIISSRTIDEISDPRAFMTIIDNSRGGSGTQFDHSKLQQFEPSLIAGGIDLQAAKRLFKAIQPLGIDTASGIETNGEIDPKKIRAVAALAQKTTYRKKVVERRAKPPKNYGAK